MDIVRLEDYSLLIFLVREYPNKSDWEKRYTQSDVDFTPTQKIVLFDDVNQDIRFLDKNSLQFLDFHSSYQFRSPKGDAIF